MYIFNAYYSNKTKLTKAHEQRDRVRKGDATQTLHD